MANSKVSELDALGSLATNDLLYVSDESSGTYTSKKLLPLTLYDWMEAQFGTAATNATSDFDADGDAAAVSTLLDNHTNATGTSVHGLGTAATLASNTWDVSGLASAAQSAAQTYADGLATNYDAVGDADAVQTKLDTHTNATGTSVHGLGTASTLASNTWDTSGSASAVSTLLDNHTNATGTSVHGLGTAATNASTDFAGGGVVWGDITGSVTNQMGTNAESLGTAATNNTEDFGSASVAWGDITGAVSNQPDVYPAVTHSNSAGTNVHSLGAMSTVGIPPWIALVDTTDYDSTPPTTSTVTLNRDITATLKAGMPMRYTCGGVQGWGYADVVATNLLTVKGNTLTTNATDLTVLEYDPIRELGQYQLFVSGPYADAADTNLMLNDMYALLRWDGAPARAVGYSAINQYGDTSATNDKVQVHLGTNAAGFQDLCTVADGIAVNDDQMYTTGVDISTNNALTHGSTYISLASDGAGGNKDALNLSVNLKYARE